MKKLKVAILMGGKSPEHEVSLVSGKNVLEHLDKEKYQVTPIVINPKGKFPIPLERPSSFDVVFIALHGPGGEDGIIQGFLETLGLPYTGSKVLASALGMNKIVSRRLFEKAGLTVPKYQIVENTIGSMYRYTKPVQLPVIVKPYNQGSSIGTSVVCHQRKLDRALKNAFSLSDKVLIEEFIYGTEVACGVLGNDDPQALPVIEICPKKEFFDYEAKYQPQKCDEIVPARISKNQTKKVQEVALKAFSAIGASGFARVDMVLKNDKVYVLEINTIPGLTPNSLFPKEARAAGIEFPELLDKIIELALEKR